MNITVFIADDHTIIRDGLRSLLEAQGDIHVVGDADNGREAVQQVHKLAPDVVLMDIAMPEVNGIDATRQITSEMSKPHVVILSMHSTSEHIFRAFQAGAFGYLLKDSAGSEVVDAVREVSLGRHYLSQKITEAMIVDYVHQGKMSSTDSPLDSLTIREREVLQLTVEGRSSAEIGKTLSISPKTVDTYRSRLMHKLGISDLPTLVRFTIQHGLTRLE